MCDFPEIVVAIAPALLLGWAAIRRAEARVIWSKRRDGRGDEGGGGE